MNRLYYLTELRLASPMSIGSGEKASTDHDIILDSKGRPTIPSSAIAGVFRHYLSDIAEKLFGSIDCTEKSHVFFYDALETESRFVTVRDCVRLKDGEKTAKDTGKFDLQAEETGAVFEAVIELDEIGCKYADRIETAIAALDSGILRLGGKSTRGYGRVKVAKLFKAEFQLPQDSDKWLDFDMFFRGDSCYTAAELPEISDSRYTRIKLELSQNGGVSIRTYTTERQQAENAENRKGADFKHITLNDGTPVIPGTSWAGAFRSRFLEFAGKNCCDNLFGYVEEKTGNCKVSRIVFSESAISGHTEKLITRTSIDRFTNGTKDSALFTERSVYNGKCVLELVVRDITDDERTTLSAVICDLDRGYLALGGGTSIGRGLFTVDRLKVNGADTTALLKAGDVNSMLREG